jgi:hypothetical protein
VPQACVWARRSISDRTWTTFACPTSASTASCILGSAIVVEILSPTDEAWQKLPFYAERKVDELLFVDPGERLVTWLALRAREYQRIDRSEVIGLSASELAGQIDWPPE